jgi:hypothetical protein
MMETYRDRIGRSVVEFIEALGLNPWVALILLCLGLSYYHLHRWQTEELSRAEKRWAISFWVLTSIGIAAWVVSLFH